MRVPRDTWEVIVDIIPGDDRVTVPMFYFDETAGLRQWREPGRFGTPAECSLPKRTWSAFTMVPTRELSLPKQR